MSNQTLKIMTSTLSLRFLKLAGCLILIAGSVSGEAPAAAQSMPAGTATIKSDWRAKVDLIKERMATRPKASETFHEIEPNDIFFPGDADDAKPEHSFGKLANFPRDAQNVEQWYLLQIPDTYEELAKQPWFSIRVLYVSAGCGGGSQQIFDPAKEFASDGYDPQDGFWISNEHVWAALIESQVNNALPGMSIAIDDSTSFYSNADFRGLNRRLLAAREKLGASGRVSPGEPYFLVFAKYCAERSIAASFPGFPEPFYPPAPPPPPPVSISYYYRVQLPPGASSALIGTFYHKLICDRKPIPVAGPDCLPQPATGGTAIRLRAAIGANHLFAVKINNVWKAGRFQPEPINIFSELDVFAPGSSPPVIKLNFPEN
ncbi:MAG: hypothetical protein ACKVOJ_11990 [Sphingomonadaceae bacterium]